MKIIKITNQDENFYQKMGPFLANRRIENEIGYQLYDDQGKTWLIAEKNGEIIGFCFCWARGEKIHEIGSIWGNENNTIQKLIQAAVRTERLGTITVVINKKFKNAITKKMGLVPNRQLKNFIEFKKYEMGKNEIKNEKSSLRR